MSLQHIHFIDDLCRYYKLASNSHNPNIHIIQNSLPQKNFIHSQETQFQQLSKLNIGQFVAQSNQYQQMNVQQIQQKQRELKLSNINKSKMQQDYNKVKYQENCQNLDKKLHYKRKQELSRKVLSWNAINNKNNYVYQNAKIKQQSIMAPQTNNIIVENYKKQQQIKNQSYMQSVEQKNNRKAQYLTNLQKQMNLRIQQIINNNNNQNPHQETNIIKKKKQEQIQSKIKLMIIPECSQMHSEIKQNYSKVQSQQKDSIIEDTIAIDKIHQSQLSDLFTSRRISRRIQNISYLQLQHLNQQKIQSPKQCSSKDWQNIKIKTQFNKVKNQYIFQNKDKSKEQKKIIKIANKFISFKKNDPSHNRQMIHQKLEINNYKDSQKLSNKVNYNRPIIKLSPSHAKLNNKNQEQKLNSYTKRFNIDLSLPKQNINVCKFFKSQKPKASNSLKVFTEKKQQQAKDQKSNHLKDIKFKMLQNQKEYLSTQPTNQTKQKRIHSIKITQRIWHNKNKLNPHKYQF